MRHPAKTQSDERGVSLLEVLIASTLALIVAIAVYDFLDHSNRSYQRESDLAAAQNTGRVAIEIFASDLRNAGYSPLGLPFYAAAGGDASKVRLLADLDGDAAVGLPGEDLDENVSYVFLGPDGEGLYEIVRGFDKDEDWVFTSTGESVETIASNVVPIDFDGDGTDEPFLSYLTAPPATTVAFDPRADATEQVTVTFGVRGENRDIKRQGFPVVTFQTTVSLRNR